MKLDAKFYRKYFFIKMSQKKYVGLGVNKIETKFLLFIYFFGRGNRSQIIPKLCFETC